MGSLLVRNIALLTGVQPAGVRFLRGAEMASTGSVADAYLVVDDGRVAAFGPMSGLTSADAADSVVDARAGMVMPSFCDSHTHVVYSGSRDGEFLDKLSGMTYEQIAARGGGILNSSDLLRATSEDDLYRQSMVRVGEVMSLGTGALEIKSGYGLDPASEMKMLRVIRRIADSVPAQVRSTFLGAHAVGRGRTMREYVDEVAGLIPEAARLADFVDVFCDKGFFSVGDMVRIIGAGARHGLRAKVHADELASIGASRAAAENGALSVDHLEASTAADIAALAEYAGSPDPTMPTMLPGTSFFLGIGYGKAREFIGAGLPLALASDYNPGSCPSGDMRFVMALGCIKMRLSPVEALNATTLNTAYAMGLEGEVGSITVGKRANFILTQPGWDLTKLVYFHHTPFIRDCYLDGVPFRR